MSLTHLPSTELQVVFNDSLNFSGPASFPSYYNTHEAHSAFSVQQSFIPFGNMELLVISTLILSLPIFIYLAYRLGKKRGRKESNSPTQTAHYYFGREVPKSPPLESTCDNSGNQGEKENDKCSSTESSPALDNLSQPSSVRQGSARESNPDGSLPKEEESMRQLMLNEESYSLPNFMLNFTKEKGAGPANEIGAEIFEERVKLHTDEEHIEKKHGSFDVRLEKKNGQFHKVETTQVRTIYSSTTPEPEENYKKMVNAYQVNAMPILNTISRLNGPTQTQSNPQAGVGSSAIVPYLKKTRSEPTNGLIPVYDNMILPFQHSNSNTGNLLSTVLDESKRECEGKEITSSQENSKVSTKETNNPKPVEDRLYNLQKLVEEYDLPDETGKFNKIFKAAELIGEGSFGEVYKVVHRVDGKIYAVKKVKLRLGRFEDLQKESKVFREVFAMTDLHHPHIVRYSTCWVEVELNNQEEEDDLNSRRAFSLENISEDNESAHRNDDEDEDEEEEDQITDSRVSELEFEWDKSATGAKADKKKEASKKLNKRKIKRKDSNTNLFKTLTMSMKEDDEDMSPNQSQALMSSLSNLSKVDPKFSGCKLYLYIQMEYCPGLSLRTYLDSPQRTISKTKILAMFRKLLEGVRVIHSRGILHRDLKPANIFLDGNENVKIGDFGLASLENVEEPMEERGRGGMDLYSKRRKRNNMHSMKVGTPLYTSPEQESGGSYDSKTDIYSLGLILCEMLELFGTHHERYMFLNKLRTKHNLPEEFMKRYPRESELILKMTLKSPNKRPTADQLIAEIDKFLEDSVGESRGRG